MPCYSFVCYSCGHKCSDIYSFTDTLPSTCPSCESADFGRDYQADVPAQPFVEPTTVGQLGERNFNALSKEQQQQMVEKSGLPKPQKTPWFRDGSIRGTKKLDKPLDTRTLKDPERYVITGEKD